MKSPAKTSLSRIVKCAISLAVYLASAAHELLLRLSNKVPPGKCVVLYYHSVPRSQRRRFALQMNAVLRHATPVPLDNDMLLSRGAKAVAITIDDAFENLLENAIPELTRRRIPAAIFAISGALGKNFGGDSEPADRVMSAEQLKSLPRELFTIGSHTVSHPFLPALSREAARRELQDSRAQLRELLQRDVRLFSFPFGGCTRALVNLCREAGYRRVFTTLPGFAFDDPGEYIVGRVRVDPTDWPLEFFLKLRGAYRWLPWLFRLKRRVLSSGLAKTLFSRHGNPPGMTIPRAVIQ
jgi:peptidoglycan/xylan/chitin deacetylase (PgdA/CDA1 family)